MIIRVNLSYKDVKKNLKLPTKLSEDLSEFLGIVGGDGHMNKYVSSSRTEYVVGLSGNSVKDVKYFESHIKSLIKKLFNICAKIYKKKGQNTLIIQLRSKGLFEYLKYLGVNVGPKTNWKLPKIIMEGKEIIQKAYLRGLFDTDGCIVLKKYNHGYPVIRISQKSKFAIKQITKLLKYFGFYFYVEYDIVRKDKRGFTSIGSCIDISGWKNLQRWAELIGSNNPRNMEKIQIALNGTGRI